MRIVTMVALMIMSELCIASIENISEDKKILWQKITEENGVVVYIQEIKGSDIVRVKAQIVIDVEMEKIQSFLDDLMYRKKWVPYLSEVRLLREYSATERLEYSHFSAPWPASDRDFVYRQKLIHKDDKKIVFVLNVEESDLMPEQNGIVRADMIESRYTLTSLGNRQTKAELIFHADPKGWLPDWIINKIQEVLPYKMLRNLKFHVEKTNKD
ncbi:MAG: START domain-containing protein [Gammaproteobacteria bacterium]|nr:START domain-containing protein [Gammaproteobacteria bacterium]